MNQTLSGLLSILIGAAIYAYSVYLVQLIARKINTPNAWLAWIPILNIFLLLRIAGKPAWWFILLLIPFVNIFIIAKVWMAISAAVQKPSWLGVLMLIPLVNFVILGYLAFAEIPQGQNLKMDDINPNLDQASGPIQEPKNYRKAIIVGVSVLLILAIAAGAWLFFSREPEQAPMTPPPAPAINPPPSITQGEKEWQLFEQFLTLAKNHDFTGLNSISVKQLTSNECPVLEECYPLLDSFYNEFAAIKKADLVNVSIDEKQSIMSTNPMPTNEGDVIVKTYLMFKKSGTSLKILSTKQKITTTKEGSLPGIFPDSDNDGLTDEEETCIGIQQYDPKCIKTNPNEKDTDGDGWWDGIELEGGYNPNGPGQL